VIDAAEVLTVLQRERRSRPEQQAAPESDLSDEPPSELLPADLAALEDTVFRDVHASTDEPMSDAEDASDNNS
jgi:hypothetical protein